MVYITITERSANYLIAAYTKMEEGDSFCAGMILEPKVYDVLNETMRANSFNTIQYLVNAFKKELKLIKIKHDSCNEYKAEFPLLLNYYVDERVLSYIKQGKVLELATFFELILDLPNKERKIDLVNVKIEKFTNGKEEERNSLSYYSTDSEADDLDSVSEFERNQYAINLKKVWGGNKEKKEAFTLDYYSLQSDLASAEFDKLEVLLKLHLLIEGDIELYTFYMKYFSQGCIESEKDRNIPKKREALSCSLKNRRHRIRMISIGLSEDVFKIKTSFSL